MTIPSEKEKVYERVMEQVDNFKRYEDGDAEYSTRYRAIAEFKGVVVQK